jgi:hypothetical protein
VTAEDGTEEEDKFFVMKTFTVFNLDQVEGDYLDHLRVARAVRSIGPPRGRSPRRGRPGRPGGVSSQATTRANDGLADRFRSWRDSVLRGPLRGLAPREGRTERPRRASPRPLAGRILERVRLGGGLMRRRGSPASSPSPACPWRDPSEARTSFALQPGSAVMMTVVPTEDVIASDAGSRAGREVPSPTGPGQPRSTGRPRRSTATGGSPRSAR